MATDTLISFDNTRAVLLEYAEALQHAYLNKLIDNDHFATCGLAQSVKYEVQMYDRIISVNFELNKYWQWVEEGRKPGKFPPISSILQWVLDKPVIPRPDANGRIPSPKSLAFLIARKIANEGTKGTHDLEQSSEQILTQFQNSIQEAVMLDVGSYLRTIIIDAF